MKSHVQDKPKLFTSLQSVRKKKEKHANTCCFLVRISMVIIKAVSLCQAALRSCCVPTIVQEQDLLTQELGEDLATVRATDSQGVPTPCFSKHPWTVA